MTDLRPLLERMANELDYLCQLLRDDRREVHALAAEARAVLAQPQIITKDRDETGPYVVVAEPQHHGDGEPSDEELTQFLFESFRSPIEFICDAEAEAHLMIRNHVKFARAVLARWGAAQPQPVPVSERLPEAGDCNGDEEVWAWRPFAPDSDEDDGDSWSIIFHKLLEDKYYGYTHWLPAHSLPFPLPSEEKS